MTLSENEELSKRYRGGSVWYNGKFTPRLRYEG